MTMFISLNISWDLDILGKVIRKRGMFTVVFPPAGDGQVVDICFMLITSKSRSLTHLICPLQELRQEGAFIGFWDLG
jgi:hypothetical protein